MIYRDGKNGIVFMKRFNVTGATRDKEYDLTKGTKGSEVLYFTANPNGESEIVEVQLKPVAGLRKLQWDINFADIAVKGRNSLGNLVTKFQIKKILLKEKGVSTLGALDVWYDDTVQRLNNDKRGLYLGSFGANDKILTVTKSGYYKLTGFDVTTHFDEDMILIEKLDTHKPLSVIYFDNESKTHFVKRFLVEPSDKKVLFISEAEGSYIEMVTTQHTPVVELKFHKHKGKDAATEKINLSEFITVKGLKAKGNKLSSEKIKDIALMPPEETPIDDAALEEFEESGLSPLEALKKSADPQKPKKPIISIDQQLNEKIKLPSEDKKKKNEEGGNSQITLDF